MASSGNSGAFNDAGAAHPLDSAQSRFTGADGKAHPVPLDLMGLTQDQLERKFFQAIIANDLQALARIERFSAGTAAAKMILPATVGGQPMRLPMLVHAAKDEYVQSLGWLVSQKGVDLNARCNTLQAPALYYAARDRQAAAVKILLAAGADPEQGTLLVLGGETPLACARRCGYDDIAAIFENFGQPAARLPEASRGRRRYRLPRGS